MGMCCKVRLCQGISSCASQMVQDGPAATGLFCIVPAYLPLNGLSLLANLHVDHVAAPKIFSPRVLNKNYCNRKLDVITI